MLKSEASRSKTTETTSVLIGKPGPSQRTLSASVLPLICYKDKFARCVRPSRKGVTDEPVLRTICQRIGNGRPTYTRGSTRTESGQCRNDENAGRRTL